MGKKDDIAQLTNIMAVSLRHRIGALVNNDDFYAEKYAKDAEHIMKEAERVLKRQHWNADDKIRIKEALSIKLHKELEEKEFLHEKKFEVMDEHIQKALQGFGLDVV